MEQLELLWLYQKEDMEADRLENEIQRSPNRLKLVKSRDYLVEQQGVMKHIEEEVAEMSDRMDNIKVAIDRLQEQLSALQAKFTAAPPEDLDSVRAMSQDAKKITSSINTFESEMKKLRKDAADRDRQQHDIRIKAAKVKAEFTQLKTVYSTEYEAKKKELDAQRAVCAAKAKGIQPEYMERYQVIKRHIIPPIAKLTNDQCGGCNMSLPSVVLRTIRSGTTIVECETCGRMLIQ